jgi:small subunit ribosomal protein S18
MKQCHFCTNSISAIDYKDVETLKTFLDLHGRILAHRRSSVCAKHQRQLSLAVKRARLLALLPFIVS